jgi:hypothetical protein
MGLRSVSSSFQEPAIMSPIMEGTVSGDPTYPTSVGKPRAESEYHSNSQGERLKNRVPGALAHASNSRAAACSGGDATDSIRWPITASASIPSASAWNVVTIRCRRTGRATARTSATSAA